MTNNNEEKITTRSVTITKNKKGEVMDYTLTHTVKDDLSFENQTKEMVNHSKDFDLPVGIYVEIENNIKKYERGLSLILDNEDWTEGSDISLEESLDGLSRILSGRDELPNKEKEFGMTRDEFLSYMSSVFLRGIVDKHPHQKVVKEIFEMSKEGGLEFGFSMKIRIEPNNHPIQDMEVFFEKPEFHESIEDWMNYVQIHSFDKMKRELN